MSKRTVRSASRRSNKTRPKADAVHASFLADAISTLAARVLVTMPGEDRRAEIAAELRDIASDVRHTLAEAPRLTPTEILSTIDKLCFALHDTHPDVADDLLDATLGAHKAIGDVLTGEVHDLAWVPAKAVAS